MLLCCFVIIQISGKETGEEESTKRVPERHEIENYPEILQPKELGGSWDHDRELNAVADSEYCSCNVERTVKSRSEEKVCNDHNYLRKCHPNCPRDCFCPEKLD